VDCDHATIVGNFEKEVNTLIRGPLEKQLVQKTMNIL
jgi:hypothetical protein